MPHWKTMIEKDYIGVWDLTDDAGRPRDFTLKIAKVTSDLVKSREVPKGKRKVVLRFDRARKAFIANSTNCETIEAMYGPDTDRWVGQSVTLYPTDVRGLKGGMVKGVRIRPKKPAGAPEELAEREVDPATRAEQDAEFRPEPNPEDDGR